MAAKSGESRGREFPEDKCQIRTEFQRDRDRIIHSKSFQKTHAQNSSHHNLQSLRVVDVLEATSSRRGMNLTAEVRDGIVNHTGSGRPFTLEGQVVKISDRVAYINHDIDDALRSGVISMEDIPKTALELFGYSHRERINNMVTDLIKNSDGRDEISQSPQFREELNKLRTFMFSHVYKSGRVKREEDLAKVEVVISSLYNYFLRDPSRLAGRSAAGC